MSKVLLIGGIGAGKTSLKQMLLNEELRYRKTQMLDFSKTFIDCPGEYLEIPRYYHVLIDTSHRVSEIWILQDATKKRTLFPPNFAKVFNKPVVGIMTKVDLAEANEEQAAFFLRYAGIVEPYYRTSIVLQEGLNSLRERLGAL